MRVRQLFAFLMAIILLLGGISCRSAAKTPSPTPAGPTAAATLNPNYTPPVNPVIEQYRIQDAFQGVFTVIWWTDRPTIGRLEYGLSEEYGSATPYTDTYALSNGISTRNLLNDTYYHFRVRVKDEAGHETVMDDVVIQIYVGYTQRRPPQESQVNISSSGFYPVRLHVSKNCMVTWTNKDSGVEHRLQGPEELWDASNNIGGAFYQSPVLAPGGTFGYYFEDPGTWIITDILHPSHTMEIVVATTGAV